jgi:hypothetical protein
MRVSIVALSLLALGASNHPGSLQAKEPTRKLIISGGGLAGGVEIVDSATLALSNVYSGNFLGPGAAQTPPPTAPRYEISFYLPQRGSWLYNIAHRPRLQVAYVVYFVPDVAHHIAYVYVPGRGDTWSDWNHGVIIRQQYEGRWTIASPAWAERINGAIARHPRLPAPRCPVSDTSTFSGARIRFTPTSAHSRRCSRRTVSTFSALIPRPTTEPSAGRQRGSSPISVLSPFCSFLHPPMRSG